MSAYDPIAYGSPQGQAHRRACELARRLLEAQARGTLVSVQTRGGATGQGRILGYVTRSAIRPESGPLYQLGPRYLIGSRWVNLVDVQDVQERRQPGIRAGGGFRA